MSLLNILGSGSAALNFLPAELLPGKALLKRDWVHPVSAKLISKMSSRKPSPAVVLDGPIGIGKSCTLTHLLSNFKSHDAQGYQPILLHIPNAGSYFEGRTPYNRNDDTGMWELPEPTVALLKTFLDNNSSGTGGRGGQVLRSVNTQASYKFAGVTLPANSSLHDLVSIGLNSVDQGSNVFKALCAELIKLPRSIVAIDHVNALFSHANYFTPSSKPIPVLKFTLGRCMASFFTDHKAKGIVVGATSRRDTRLKWDISKTAIKSADVVNIPPYTRSDAQQILHLYTSTSVTSASPAIDQSLLNIDRLLLLSGGNPEKFHELAQNPMLF